MTTLEFFGALRSLDAHDQLDAAHIAYVANFDLDLLSRARSVALRAEHEAERLAAVYDSKYAALSQREHAIGRQYEHLVGVLDTTIALCHEC